VEFDLIHVAPALALAVALFGIWRGERTQSRARANELYLLRQTVLLKAEATRTEWYALNRENDMLIHRLSLNRELHSELRKVVSEFLQGAKEFLSMCIADATALADDVFANGENFSEKKCREYLRLMDVSLEKLRRNQGVSELKFNELMERAAHHSGTVSGT
jgi:hypothetical protein